MSQHQDQSATELSNAELQTANHAACRLGGRRSLHRTRPSRGDGQTRRYINERRGKACPQVIARWYAGTLAVASCADDAGYAGYADYADYADYAGYTDYAGHTGYAGYAAYAGYADYGVDGVNGVNGVRRCRRRETV